MNDRSADGHAAGLRHGASDSAHLPAHAFNDGAEGVLHVLGHLAFLLAPCEVEAQHRDAPAIDDSGIDLAKAFGVGNHLAAAGDADRRSVLTPDVLLETLSETLMLTADAVERAHRRVAEV